MAAAVPQVKDTDLKLETAMSLYGLRKFELLWERALDSKALIAWNDDTVVLAFRGTASLANLWADLQVRRRARFHCFYFSFSDDALSEMHDLRLDGILSTMYWSAKARDCHYALRPCRDAARAAAGINPLQHHTTFACSTDSDGLPRVRTGTSAVAVMWMSTAPLTSVGRLRCRLGMRPTRRGGAQPSRPLGPTSTRVS